MTNVLPNFLSVSEDVYWILPRLVDDEGEVETMRSSLFSQAYLKQCGLKQLAPKNINLDIRARIDL